MSYLTDDHTGYAVYWGNPTPDGFGGFSWDAPVELSVRWEERTRQFLSSDGILSVSRAVIYLGQDVENDGVLWQGRLTDLSTAEKADPRTVSGAQGIRRFDKIPELDGSDYERVAYL